MKQFFLGAKTIRFRLLGSLFVLLGFQLAFVYVMDSIGLQLGTSLIVLFGISCIVIVIIVTQALVPITNVIQALDTGVNSFKDKDFSITLDNKKYHEFELIINSYNELSKIMRDERMTIFQRELMLDTVIQSTPVALILTNNLGNIVYSNAAAKTLLNQNRKLEGLNFANIFQQMPHGLSEATLNKQDGLVTETINEQTIVYHLNYKNFNLNSQTHHMYLYKNLTPEISRKQSDIWKQVIRLISHELNNSLAPINSLTNSAKKIVDSHKNADMLPDILDTIAKRSQHLHQFIEQYAMFARLPKPQIASVELSKFVEQISNICAVKVAVTSNQTHWDFDETQIEQVLINLVKNAKESESVLTKILVKIDELADCLQFSVEDEGKGMSEFQLQQALLPFYSTKATGTGIGLTLCNEIVFAHNGKLKIENRVEKGLKVSFSIPQNLL